ncbi:hypothetical protein [Azospirillum thermophilum]|uniref:Uncharacterized protein n=1 Tax=Azospirillum thermophilum TaxID=2202148 RepID=A0A2S2CL67_9PROT|nr:hypothetical protein [Azospirillum thermophilum]AWK85057.1 hypothetical protein DEW08_01635 [Azospirillum thermophilum]
MNPIKITQFNSYEVWALGGGRFAVRDAVGILDVEFISLDLATGYAMDLASPDGKASLKYFRAS